MLRYVALAALFLVVYALILRPVKKLAMTAFRELPGKAGHPNRSRPQPPPESPPPGFQLWSSGRLDAAATPLAEWTPTDSAPPS